MRILSREMAAPRVSGFFLNAVVQAVLLFRMNTWVVTPCMGKAMGGVSGKGGDTADRAAPADATNGKLKYTLMVMAREEAGVLVEEEYIRRHQNTVAQYTVTRSLLDLCEGLEIALGGAGRDAVMGTGWN